MRSIKPLVRHNISGADAISFGGHFIFAICHKQGVDIISCDSGKYIQLLRECYGAKIVLWSPPSAHLAVYARGILFVYQFSVKSSSLNPLWTSQHQISITSADILEASDTLSFAYPWILVGQHEFAQLLHCETGVIHQVMGPLGSPHAAKLSSSGLTLAISYYASNRIDFLEVHHSGCNSISHAEHANEVSQLMWRSSYSTDRELLLCTDASNLIRIWAVEYRKSFNALEASQAEVHLILELGDYVNKPIAISWVAHGLATASETSFLAESPIKDRVKRGSAMPPMPSGCWLAILEESGIVRFYCISNHQFSKHLECFLKGHGPKLESLSGHMVLSLFCCGRFSSTGSDRPLAIEIAAIYDMEPMISFSQHNPSITTISAESQLGGLSGSPRVMQGLAVAYGSSVTSATSVVTGHRRLVRLVSAITDRRPAGFIAVEQSFREFIVDDEATEQITGPYTHHLPTRTCGSWRLSTWDTICLDGVTGNPSKRRIVPKTYRALLSPWASVEAVLWNWAHQFKNTSILQETQQGIGELLFEPLDITIGTSSGFEVTHDIIRTVWLLQPHSTSTSASMESSSTSSPTKSRSTTSTLPSSSSISSSASKRKPSITSSDNPPGSETSGGYGDHSREDNLGYSSGMRRGQLLVTLQKKQLGSYVIAVWLADTNTEKTVRVNLSPDAVEDDVEEYDGKIPAQNKDFSSTLRPGDSVASTAAVSTTDVTEGRTQLDNTYEVSIAPDLHFGLGLRLDVVDGRILVESYKRNPLTMKPMPAEECGIIGIGDELLAINGNNLKGSALADVIQTIRGVVQNARGSDVILQMRSAADHGLTAPVKSSEADAEPSSANNNNNSNNTNSSNTNNNIREDLGGNSARWFDGPTLGRSSVESPKLKDSPLPLDDLSVRMTKRPSWELVNSWPLDDCVAVDIALGGGGAAASNIGVVASGHGVLLVVVVALRRVRAGASEQLEICVWELTSGSTHSNGELTLRLVSKWGAPEPYTFQIWRNEGDCFTLCGMTAGGHMVVRRLEYTPQSASSTSVGDSAQPSSSIAIKRPMISRSITAAGSLLELCGSDWHMSALCYITIDCGEYVDVLGSSTQWGRDTSGQNLLWMPLCPPFDDGRKTLVLGSAFAKHVLIVKIHGSKHQHIPTTNNLNDIENSPWKKGLSQENSDDFQATVPCLAAEVIQVIEFKEPVRWARFVGLSTMQICAGSILTILTKRFGSDAEGWQVSSTIDFCASDRPTSLSSAPINTPSPWNWSGTSDPDEKIISESAPPDWHPISIGMDLFSAVNSDKFLDDISTSNAMQTVSTALHNALSRLSALCKAFELTSSSSSSSPTVACYPNKVSASLEYDNKLNNVTSDTIKSTMNKLLPISRLLLHRGRTLPFKLSSVLLDPPVKSLNVADVISLSILGSCISDYQDIFLSKKSSISGGSNENYVVDVSAIQKSNMNIDMFSRLDIWGIHAVLLHHLNDMSEGLMTNNASEEGKSPRRRARVSGVAVANAMVSNSQEELFNLLIGSEANNAAGPGEKTGLQFGMLWWARNEAGKDIQEGEYDVFRALTSTMAALWLHDISPLISLIETKVVQQFRDQRDAMQIFLEMVTIGKTDKLLQLSKTDKNVMGKQLQTLLSFNFETERGRNAARKNAYALLRLQRFKHAAAAFLCAEPPMLKEAVRILVRNLNDPFLALLVARIVEHRMGTSVKSSGLVLGPVSRRLLQEDVIPFLKANASSGALSTIDITPIDGAMLSLSCALWLQDRELIRRVAVEVCELGMFSCPLQAPLIIKIRHSFGVCASVYWLVKQEVCRPALMDIAYCIDSFMEEAGLVDSRYIGCKLLRYAVLPEDEPAVTLEGAFTKYCRKVKRAWREQQMIKEMNRRAEKNKNLTNNYASNQKDVFSDEVGSALQKLQKMSAQSNLGDDLDIKVAINDSAKRGFNFAVGAIRPGEHAPEGTSVDIPLSQSTNMNTLNMFDAPPPQAKTKPAPANMLDMFDATPPQAKSKPAPANMLDMFDAPPPQPKSKPAPANMLDMFDAPPPQAKSKPAPVNMLDMYSAQDSSDGCIKVASDSLVDKSTVQKVDEDDDTESELLAQFFQPYESSRNNSIDSGPYKCNIFDNADDITEGGTNSFYLSPYSLLLSSAGRAAIFQRCAQELQLCLGYVTMSHPFALSGDLSDYIQV